MSVRILSADEVIGEIAAALAEADGEFIAEIANRVLTPKFFYKEDSIFEEVREDDDLANQDEFECQRCHGTFDIEDSIKLGGELYCPACSKSKDLSQIPLEGLII